MRVASDYIIIVFYDNIAASDTPSFSTVTQINDEAIAAFVEGGGVSLDKYRRASSRVPLPLKFDDHSQASHPPGSTMVWLVTASRVLKVLSIGDETIGR